MDIRRAMWLAREKRIIPIVLAAYLAAALLFGAATSTVYASLLVLTIASTIMNRNLILASIAATPLLVLLGVSLVNEGISIIALLIALWLGWTARSEDALEPLVIPLIAAAICTIALAAWSSGAIRIWEGPLLPAFIVIAQPIIGVWYHEKTTAARYGGY